MLSTEVPSDRLCKGSKSFRATIIRLSLVLVHYWYHGVRPLRAYL